MQHTVKSLREKGYSIRIYHIRKYEPVTEYELVANPDGFTEQPKRILLSRGGSTDVAVTTPTGENVRAIAYCSDKDGYNKRRGVMIALGRAMKELNDPAKKQLRSLDQYV